MELAESTPNPFALLITPDAVFEALNRSDRLSRLSSRICRPLDERQARLEGTEARKADAADTGSALRVTLAS
jgi:hypothetical protein